MKVFFKFGPTPIGLIWMTASLVMLIGHFYNNVFNKSEDFFKSAPKIVQDCFLFGKTLKTATKPKKIITKTRRTHAFFSIQVPKKWFTHFYIISTLTNGYLLFICYQTYFLRQTAPAFLIKVLNLLTLNEYSTTPYFVNCDKTTVILVLFCLSFQGLRRLFECIFVSKFSDSKMHVFHYFAGVFFYSCQGVTLLLGARNLTYVPKTPGSDRFLDRLNGVQIIGLVMFIFFSGVQFWCHTTLSDLRKNKKVDKNEHGIAEGGFFEFVSAPNMMAECGIYLSIFTILEFHHFMFLLVVCFVLTNQTLAAILTHQWYKKTFKNYPKNRRAILPHLL